MDLYNSIIDLKIKEESKPVDFFITKKNLKKLSRHTRKSKLTKSKFIDYFFQKITHESLIGLNKEPINTQKCIKTKRTIKVKNKEKMKEISTNEKITFTTLINRLVEKHL